MSTTRSCSCWMANCSVEAISHEEATASLREFAAALWPAASATRIELPTPTTASTTAIAAQRFFRSAALTMWHDGRLPSWARSSILSSPSAHVRTVGTGGSTTHGSDSWI